MSKDRNDTEFIKKFSSIGCTKDFKDVRAQNWIPNSGTFIRKSHNLQSHSSENPPFAGNVALSMTPLAENQVEIINDSQNIRNINFPKG